MIRNEGVGNFLKKNSEKGVDENRGIIMFSRPAKGGGGVAWVEAKNRKDFGC